MSTVEPLRPAPRRRPTSTSAFGVGRREAHDSSPFYARFTPPLLSDDDRVHAKGPQPRQLRGQVEDHTCWVVRPEKHARVRRKREDYRDPPAWNQSRSRES